MTTPVSDPRFATTLGRGLSVLRAFRINDRSLSNAEIAQRTGLPKSTVSRLTFTLNSLGYLTKSTQDERFRPGPTLVAVGQVASASLSFLPVAHDLMSKLADDCGTLVVLAVRDGTKLVLIRTWRPAKMSSIWLDVGHKVPLRGLSSARAFLGAASQAELDRIAAEFPVTDAQPFGPMPETRDRAYADLLRCGFVFSPGGPGEPAPYNAVSAPFRGLDLPEPVVFTCGALPEAADAVRMETEIGPKLAAAIRSLEVQTGHPPTLTRSEASA